MSETLQTRERKAQPPREGEWFEVKPKTIDRKLFEEEREDSEQERTRQLILEALSKLDENPERYGKDFKILMPKKDWRGPKTVKELKDMACKLGDHNADWVEKALEWAQRISNGEAWETICNKEGTVNHSSLVIWKNGRARIVGGIGIVYWHRPASDVCPLDYLSDILLDDTVPSVVSYEAA